MNRLSLLLTTIALTLLMSACMPLGPLEQTEVDCRMNRMACSDGFSCAATDTGQFICFPNEQMPPGQTPEPADNATPQLSAETIDSLIELTEFRLESALEQHETEGPSERLVMPPLEEEVERILLTVDEEEMPFVTSSLSDEEPRTPCPIVVIPQDGTRIHPALQGYSGPPIFKPPAKLNVSASTADNCKIERAEPEIFVPAEPKVEVGIVRHGTKQPAIYTYSGIPEPGPLTNPAASALIVGFRCTCDGENAPDLAPNIRFVSYFFNKPNSTGSRSSL